jgi:hypothetical protein
MSRLRVWALLLVSFALVYPAIAEGRTYEGRVNLPEGHTRLRIEVRMRHHEPKDIKRIRSGATPLDCEHGERATRIDIRQLRRSHLPVGDTGRFTIRVFTLRRNSSVQSLLEFKGRIRPHHSRGWLRYHSSNATEGRCTTRGWLRWVTER